VFLKPVSTDLHVSRGMLSSGLVLASRLNALGCVPVGFATRGAS
jgi:hypothetical protein